MTFSEIPSSIAFISFSYKMVHKPLEKHMRLQLSQQKYGLLLLTGPILPLIIIIPIPKNPSFKHFG